MKYISIPATLNTVFEIHSSEAAKFLYKITNFAQDFYCL